MSGGTVIPGADAPDAEAIAWAHGVILAVGSRTDVTAISRGDSALVELGGACVIPLADGAEPGWPTSARLEVGGPADMALLAADPRRHGGEAPGGRLEAIAIIRGGRVVSGALPG
jgi:hypothetical protein